MDQPLKQKIFDYALKTFLFLSPIFLFSNYRVSMARGLFFVLGSFALFAFSLGVEPKRKFNNIWISLFLILAFIRIFFNNSLSPQTEWFNFWFSCASFIYVFCGVLLFYTVYTQAENVKQYFYPVLWVCILNCVLALAQVFKYDFLWTNTQSLCGFMETSSQLGQYSALAIPLVFVINPFLTLIPLTTLIMAKSISPILACILVAIINLFRKASKSLLVLVGILVVLLYVLNIGYIKSKFACRPVMWQKTTKIALQKPFLGWGYQSFAEKVTEVKEKGSIGGPEKLRAHNDYLHTVQELGFPILVVIALFFIDLFKRFRRSNKLLLIRPLGFSILTVLIIMSGQTLIRYASIAGTFTVLLALFCVEVENELTG